MLKSEGKVKEMMIIDKWNRFFTKNLTQRYSSYISHSREFSRPCFFCRRLFSIKPVQGKGNQQKTKNEKYGENYQNLNKLHNFVKVVFNYVYYSESPKLFPSSLALHVYHYFIKQIFVREI